MHFSKSHRRYLHGANEEFRFCVTLQFNFVFFQFRKRLMIEIPQRTHTHTVLVGIFIFIKQQKGSARFILIFSQ